MAKDKLIDYDSTAANNTDIGGISIDEGMLPSNVNNALREVMSHLKDFAAGTEAISALDVAGTITSDGLTVDGTYTDVKFKTNQGRLDLWLTDTDTTDGQVRIRGDANTLSFITNTTVGMTIDASQNVGIGTSSISSGFKMEVTGDARFGDAYNDDAVELGWSAGGSVGFVQAYDRGASAFRDLQLNNAVTIKSGGSVGIGTSSPDEKLHIEGGANTRLKFDYTSNWEASIGIDGAAGALTFENVDGSERMRIDSSGNLLVGGTTFDNGNLSSQANGINVFDATAPIVNVVETTGDTSFYMGKTTSLCFLGTADAHPIVFSTNDTQRMRIDSSGRVGIGTSDPSSNTSTYYDDLVIKNDTSGTGAGITLQSNSTNGFGGLEFRKADGTEVAKVFGSSAGGHLGFETGGAERMRIDSSGKLLVGKSVTTQNTKGVNVNGSDGRIETTSDGNVAAIFNRITSDGDITLFRKAGVTIGSIGVIADHIVIADGDTGLKFDNGFDAIVPASSTANRDNAIDLGFSTVRFDDIYATNGTIQTSDANEKQQIASLTDAEITAAKAISKLFKTFKWNDSVEEKGDAARTHAGVIAQDVQQAMSDAGLDAANYAFWCSDTWWETQTEVPAVEAVEAQDAVYDDDGNLVSEAVEAVEAQDAYTRTDTYDTAEEAPEGATERTRMGIRYPELLAFIGAATEQRLADIETRLTALEN